MPRGRPLQNIHTAFHGRGVAPASSSATSAERISSTIASGLRRGGISDTILMPTNFDSV